MAIEGNTPTEPPSQINWNLPGSVCNTDLRQQSQAGTDLAPCHRLAQIRHYLSSMVSNFLVLSRFIMICQILSLNISTLIRHAKQVSSLVCYSQTTELLGMTCGLPAASSKKQLKASDSNGLSSVLCDEWITQMSMLDPRLMLILLIGFQTAHFRFSKADSLQLTISAATPSFCIYADNLQSSSGSGKRGTAATPFGHRMQNLKQHKSLAGHMERGSKLAFGGTQPSSNHPKTSKKCGKAIQDTEAGSYGKASSIDPWLAQWQPKAKMTIRKVRLSLP